MPLYEIEHKTLLSTPEKDGLALAITQIHSQLFTTPSLFVNVRFTCVANDDVYVGGKKRDAVNRILAHVRPGGDRSVEQFNTLCTRLHEAWERVVGEAKGKREGREMGRELRAIFVLGTIVAGTEAGFALPRAGKDKEWLRVNMGELEKRAEGGDVEFGDLLEEMRTRDDLRESL